MALSVNTHAGRPVTFRAVPISDFNFERVP
jgi:hypothetical protein